MSKSTYKSATRAATAALDAVIGQSEKTGWEYAGRIVKLANGKYAYTSPTTEQSSTASDPDGGMKEGTRIPAGTNANIAAVLWAETGEAGAYEFFKRLVISVLIGNGDMHLKNWSLLYPDGHKPVLTPAYDFVATFPYLQNDSLALTFGDSRSLKTIEPDQVRRFAEAARIPAMPLWKIAVETAASTVSAWEQLAEKDLLPAELRKKIEAQILTVARNL